MAADKALFWQLVEAEHARARAFCRKLTGSREDGDDLYHDVLVLARKRFGQLRETASFRPWLYRTVVNSYRNSVRRPWWRRFTPLTREVEESTPGANPDAIQAARRRLEYAFRAISPEERALVTLFETDGWSVAELARLFDRSEAAIKMRLSRARRKMREAIVKRYYSNDTTTTKLREDGLCVAVKPGED